MKLLKVQAVQMGVIILFVVLSLCFGHKNNIQYEDEGYESYQSGWSISVNDKTKERTSLPSRIDTQGSGQITLKKKLSRTIVSADCIGFYTSHQILSVYIGDEMVYQLSPQKGVPSKTPGNTWNFVKLKESDAGETIRIVIADCYRKQEIQVPNFYYGSKDAIIMQHISQNSLSFLLSLLMLLIGVLLVSCWIFAGKAMRWNEGIPWLGMFAVSLAVWSAMECQILPLFMGRPLLFSQLAFMAMKLLPVSILQFVGIIYGMRSSRIRKAFCIVSLCDFFGTFLLQFLGWADYKETLWITQAVCVLAAVCMLYMTGKIILEKGDRSRKSKRAVIVNAFFIGLVSLSVLLDVFRFYYLHPMDSARFCRIGLLLYIIGLTMLLLNDSVRLIRAGQQVQRIKEEAETDVMTKLKNRMSFERDLAQISGADTKKYGIVMFDLNNLKKFNDSYGHSMGDYYIIICSEIIQDIFGSHGRVYRIGGDEFCAIVKRLDEDKIEELRRKMNRRIKSLSGQHFNQAMEIALGYAGFDPESDRNLADTMKRADEVMYKNKNGMKA